MAGSVSQRMAEEMKQITIAGGGLAGLALGIALRHRGVPVILHEALRYPRHRVCGEFISGVEEKTLAALGIGHCFSAVPRPAEVQWWSGEMLLGRFPLPCAAYAVSRHALDARLCEMLRSLGGVVEENSRATATAVEGTVWAAGRRPTKGPWLGLKAHVRGITLEAGLEMHLGRDGYLGLVEVDEGWVNVCGLFRTQPGIQAAPTELLLRYLRYNGLNSLHDRLAAATWRDGSHSAVAGFHLGMQEPLPGLVSVGDSHSIIPPFTGNGMSMALEAAALAVEPLHRFANGGQDWAQTREQLTVTAHRRFQRRVSLALGCQQLLLAPWFRRPLEILAQQNLLPFRPLFALTRR
jgi:menaquinone-9 beta-reductase